MPAFPSVDHTLFSGTRLRTVVIVLFAAAAVAEGVIAMRCPRQRRRQPLSPGPAAAPRDTGPACHRFLVLSPIHPAEPLSTPSSPGSLLTGFFGWRCMRLGSAHWPAPLLDGRDSPASLLLQPKCFYLPRPVASLSSFPGSFETWTIAVRSSCFFSCSRDVSSVGIGGETQSRACGWVWPSPTRQRRCFSSLWPSPRGGTQSAAMGSLMAVLLCLSPALFLGWERTNELNQPFRSGAGQGPHGDPSERIGARSPQEPKPALRDRPVAPHLPTGHSLHSSHPLYFQFFDLTPETADAAAKGMALFLVCCWPGDSIPQA